MGQVASTEAVASTQVVEPEENLKGIFVVRTAAAVMRLPSDASPMFMSEEARSRARQAGQEVRDALERDPRVASMAEVNHFSALNARTTEYVEVDTKSPNVLDVLTDYLGLRLNEPLEFLVHVPAKNQPLYRGAKDLPADDYWVLWDGDTVLVQWEQADSSRSHSGGHIVLDVLGDAVKKAGLELSVIACSPGCLHRFLHVDFATFSEANSAMFDTSRSETAGSIIVPWARPEDPWENIRKLWAAIGNIVPQYAQAKTQALAVLGMEYRARAGVQAVLEIAHKRVTKRTAPHLVGWVVDSFALFGSRRFTKQRMSELWVALVEIDTRRRSWADAERHLTDLCEQEGLGGSDTLKDVDQRAVESIDVGLLRDTIQELSARREGRMLVTVTLVGAVAALIGTLAGALLVGTGS